MVRLVCLGILMLVAGAPSAMSGAWPREPGTGFLATSATVSRARDFTGSFYAEYGWTPRFTLGVDADGLMDRIGLPVGTGIAFLRYALSPPDATHKWAVHAGLGARYESNLFHFSQEIGLSWGRGFRVGENYGWIGVDGSVNFAADPLHRITKLDTVVGVPVSQRTKLMGQLYLTQTQGESFKTIAPSLLISQKDGPYTLQIGAEFPLGEAGDNRLKIGLWRDF